MLQSQLFYKTKKEAPKEAKIISHKLLLRAGFISQLATGVYNFLPLGWRVHKKIEDIIREEIEKIGGQEIFLPTLQPKEIWQKTNRWEKMAPPLFKLKDIHKKEFALGPTHEEVITQLAKLKIQSYKDLPFYLFQIQSKFRNEMRATGGLLRVREFIMKDLYSFHSSEKDFENYFEKIANSYEKIFKRCGLLTIKSEAAGGSFTEAGAKTYEFQVPAESGEDKILFCQKCKFAINLETAKIKNVCPKCKAKLKKINTIEVGHIFDLGTKYSEAFQLYFVDETGVKKPVIMGCYGIGLGRLMATVVEVYHDERGIIWPKAVAPFLVHLIQIPSPARSRAKVKKRTKFSSPEDTKKVKENSEKLYQSLQKAKIEVLYDDREDKTAGEKLVESDLIGIPLRIVVSERTLVKNCVEVKKRNEKKVKLVKIKQLPRFLNF